MKNQTKVDILIACLSYGAFMRSIRIGDEIASGFSGAIFVAMFFIVVRHFNRWMDQPKEGE